MEKLSERCIEKRIRWGEQEARRGEKRTSCDSKFQALPRLSMWYWWADFGQTDLNFIFRENLLTSFGHAIRGKNLSPISLAGSLYNSFNTVRPWFLCENFRHKSYREQVLRLFYISTVLKYMVIRVQPTLSH